MAEQEQNIDTEAQPQAKPVSEDEWLLSRREDLEPKEFAEGFTMKTVIGALFVGIVMMPGSIYLGLMMGQTIGPAAQWTTIILFTEIARRSFTKMSRQELYMIYYMAGSLAGGGALAGGAFAWLIWAQYLVQSPQAHQFGIAGEIPSWYAPHVGSPAYIQRTFLHPDWTVPILLLVMGSILGRAQWIGMGYFLFRTTSDVERLPFPFAPIAAQGATALAEVSEEKESWRWPVFSVGAMVGLVYGFFYVAIPVITSGFLADPLKLIPIPFLDLMQNTEDVFPAGRIGLATDLGSVFWGFVAPYPLIAGSFIGSILSNFVFAPALYRMSYNPALEHSTIFPKWAKGMNLIQSEMTTGFDLFMSIGIGISLAIAVIGIYTVITTLLKARVQRAKGGPSRSYADVPKGRGDFSLSLAVGVWAVTTAIYVIVGHILVPRFNVLYFIAAAFVWTPIVSYISARMYGLTGQPVSIPYVRQATFILSKYQGIDIWFAPFPMADHGWAAASFREVELTGTKVTSVVKAEAFLLVFMLIASFAYWSFFWKTSPIPSSQYPYVQMYWPLDAFYTCLWATATDPKHSGSTFLLQAIKFPIIGYAGGGALALYIAMSALKIPVFWFYGFVGGFTSNTLGAFPTFIGALLGRHYFARRFGLERWRQYTPVLAAGYFCGVGLIGMVSIGLTIIFKAVRSLPF